jgi:hypothetical protein
MIVSKMNGWVTCELYTHYCLTDKFILHQCYLIYEAQQQQNNKQTHDIHLTLMLQSSVKDTQY